MVLACQSAWPTSINCLFAPSLILFFFPSQRAEINLAPLQDEARLQSAIKATTTIAITIAAHLSCCVPSIVYTVVGLREENQTEIWFGFIAGYSLYISSAVNPVIYYLRASRFRSAYKQFLKDPFGSSDFKQRPSGPVIEKKENFKEKGRKQDGEKARKLET